MRRVSEISIAAFAYFNAEKFKNCIIVPNLKALKQSLTEKDDGHHFSPLSSLQNSKITKEMTKF